MTSKNKNVCSVTDLSKMVICENQTILSKKFPNSRNKNMKDGIVAHKNFEINNTSENQVDFGEDKRCYIASAIYGAEHPKTQYLRAWRDNVLLKNKLGKIIVSIYYNISKKIIMSSFFRLNFVQNIIRFTLNKIIKHMKYNG